MQSDGKKLPKVALQPLAESRARAYARQTDPHRSNLNLSLAWSSSLSMDSGCETGRVNTRDMLVSPDMRQ